VLPTVLTYHVNFSQEIVCQNILSCMSNCLALRALEQIIDNLTCTRDITSDYFFMFITSNSSSAFLITCSNLSNYFQFILTLRFTKLVRTDQSLCFKKIAAEIFTSESCHQKFPTNVSTRIFNF
jgi:hypothetical protein